MEVVGRVRGSRGREAELLVRATARFCAAFADVGTRRSPRAAFCARRRVRPDRRIGPSYS